MEILKESKREGDMYTYKLLLFSLFISNFVLGKKVLKNSHIIYLWFKIDLLINFVVVSILNQHKID